VRDSRSSKELSVYTGEGLDRIDRERQRFHLLVHGERGRWPLRGKTMIVGDALRILLVEDDDDHAEIVARALASLRVINRIHRVSDGEAALDYFFAAGLTAIHT
jgi:hypothetical protein